MKGLLMKEFYSALLYLKNFVFMLAIAIAISLFMDMGSTYVTMMLMMYLLIVSINQYSVDEKTTWNPYSLALPVQRVTIVGARYLFLFLMMVASMFFSFAIGAGFALAKGYPDWLASNLITAGVGAILFLVINGLSSPVIYKFGAEKARYVIMIFYMVPFMAIILFNKQIEAMVPALLENIVPITVVAAITSIFIYLASLFISTRIYANKEY